MAVYFLGFLGGSLFAGTWFVSQWSPDPKHIRISINKSNDWQKQLSTIYHLPVNPQAKQKHTKSVQQDVGLHWACQLIKDSLLLLHIAIQFINLKNHNAAVDFKCLYKTGTAATITPLPLQWSTAFSQAHGKKGIWTEHCCTTGKSEHAGIHFDKSQWSFKITVK